ncbi:MAG TPA: hypothetical protein VMF89_15860, partial [Polyangiales bacterium]|nr:hypothetical protein [Polyangiales bacterium]
MSAVIKLGVISIVAVGLGCSSGSDSGTTGDEVTTQTAGAPASAGASAQAGRAGMSSAGQSGARAAVGGRNVGGAGAAGTAAAAGAGGVAAGSGGDAAGSAGVAAGSGAAGAAGSDAQPGQDVWNDPGTSPWQLVPDDQVATECKLDPAMLATNDSQFTSGWAVVRYGKLCHEAGPSDSPTEAYSATKTLGGLVTGIASYETRMIAKSGPRTGQLLDTDMASHWLMNQSYNEEALVGHVLGMEGHN